MTPLWAWRLTEDQVVPWAPLPEELDEATLALPPGFYTTFRTYDGGRRVYGLCTHLRRLYRPAQRLGWRPVVPLAHCPERLARLLAPLRPREMRVRLVLHEDGRLSVLVVPFVPPAPEVLAQGVRVVTVPLARRRPHLKRTAFILRSRAEREAVRAQGAYEGLLVRAGRVWEGLTSNFFYVRRGVVGTAQRGVLPGVTRRAVLYLVRRLGLPLVYEPLPLTRLDEVDEAFLTSSSRGVVPVVVVDGRPVGTGRPGPVTRQLQQAYVALVQRRALPLTAVHCR